MLLRFNFFVNVYERILAWIIKPFKAIKVCVAVNDSDKHFSLLRYEIRYDCKKFYDAGTRWSCFVLIFMSKQGGLGFESAS